MIRLSGGNMSDEKKDNVTIKEYFNVIKEKSKKTDRAVLSSIISNVISVLLITYFIASFYFKPVLLVPPEIKNPITVSYAKPTENYISEMAVYIVSLSQNWNYSNYKEKMNWVLKYVAPKYTEEFQDQIDKEYEKISNYRRTQNFYEKIILFDKDNILNVKIEGTFMFFMDGVKTIEREGQIEIEFIKSRGGLLIKYMKPSFIEE